MLSIFSCVFWPSVCLLWRNVCLGLFAHFLIGLFVFRILSCMRCLYILEINPLSVASFAIIFSHFEDCLFIMFIVFFAVQNLLSFIRFHLFIFVYVSINLGAGSERILLWHVKECTVYVFLWELSSFWPYFNPFCL